MPTALITGIKGGVLLMLALFALESRSTAAAPDFISVRDFKATGNGTTDDTASVQAALNAATPGTEIYFPPGRYAVCSLSITGRTSFLHGAGMMTSILVRHPSCLQVRTNILNIKADSVVIRDLGFDMRTDGSHPTNSIVDIVGASSVDIGSSYFTHAQSVGVQISRCDNVHIHGNEFKENWWFGVSVASGGTTETPNYNRGFTVTGNILENTPIGVGFSFFLSDISVSGNVFFQSNLSLIQMPHAYAEVTGNTFDGSAAYGCGASCSAASNYPAIFLEGVGDYNIAANQIHSPSGSGILCQGSNLRIPINGKIMQLPCTRGSIYGNQIDHAEHSYPILISAAASDKTPGFLLSIADNQIVNSHSCITVASADGVQETGNTCAESAIAGYFLTSITNAVFRGNNARNVGKSTGNFSGLEINGTSQNIDVDANDFTCEPSLPQCMHFGVHDATLESGVASQVRHCGNTIRGATAEAWFPQPAIPTKGDWGLGDCIENFPKSPRDPQSLAEPTAWRNVRPGSPGTWMILGKTTVPSCVTASSPASCQGSTFGSVAIAPGRSSLLVNTNAVQSNSHIFLQEDQSLDSVLKVDCDSGVGAAPRVSTRDAGHSFTIVLPAAPVLHYACFSFWVDSTH